MDWSIFLGILGIAVSVIVGWVTYRFADRRARNQKYRSAKSSVLQELSKSLGEDSIPTPAIIQATMRSVLRESGDPNIEIDVDEVLDDLMRQVTADPFLDGDRRRKLQGDIEQVRDEARDLRIQLSREEAKEAAFHRSSAFPSLATFVGAVTTALTATLMVTVTLERLPEVAQDSIVQRFLETGGQEEWLSALSMVLVIPVILFLFFRLIDEGVLRRFVQRFRRGRR